MKLSPRVNRVALVAVAGLAIGAGLVAPAEAVGDGPYNIQAVQGSPVSVGSTSCHDVTVTADYVNPLDADYLFSADVQVSHAGRPMPSATVMAEGGSSPDPTLPASSVYGYCPSYGLGTFTLGPSTVTGTSNDGGTSRTFTDSTRGTFLAKRASHTTLAVARPAATPKWVRFTTTVSAYLLGKDQYVRWPAKYVHIQRLAASGWHDVKVVKTSSNGLTRATLYAPNARQWRATTLGTPLAWGSVSGVHATHKAPPPPPVPDSAIRISRVQYDSPGSDQGGNHSLNAEWVRITNNAGRGKNLTGWTLSDRTGHVYHFPAFTLRGGSSATVHTGHGYNNATNLYWRQSWYIWNNTGDRATIRNAHTNIVDRCSWGAGPGSTSC